MEERIPAGGKFSFKYRCIHTYIDMYFVLYTICTIYLNLGLTIRLLLAQRCQLGRPRERRSRGAWCQRTDITAGQALRKQVLLRELEERKAIKNRHLEEKRGLSQEISALEEGIRGLQADLGGRGSSLPQSQRRRG